MALTSKKVKQMPSDAPGAGIFGRDEDKDFHIGGQQMVELYYVSDDGGAATGTIATGFELVQGGYFYNITDDAASSVIDVKPNQATPSTADISGLPSLAKTYVAVIFGLKIPNALV